MVNTRKYIDLYSGKDEEFKQYFKIVHTWSYLVDNEESLKTKDPETGEDKILVEYSPGSVIGLTGQVYGIFMKYAAKGRDSPYADFVRSLRKALDEAYPKVESSYKIIRRKSMEQKEEIQKNIEGVKGKIKESKSEEEKKNLREVIRKLEEGIEEISYQQKVVDSLISRLYR